MDTNNNNNTIQQYIGKERFCKIMEDIKKQMQMDDRFNSATKRIDSLSQGFYYNYELVLNNLIDILNYALSGNNDEDWVSWWIYETDFGKHTNTVYTGDNEDNMAFTLTTAEDLWDFVHDDYDNLVESDEKPDNNIRKTTEVNLSDILKQDCNK